jgi:hypothetical protein
MESKSYQTKGRKSFETTGLDLSKSVVVNCEIPKELALRRA